MMEEWEGATPFAQFTFDLMNLFAGLVPEYVGKTHDNRRDKIKPEDGTLVGNLDIYAMERIATLIQSNFPDDLIIAEEDKGIKSKMSEILVNQEQWQWTVDGLDGTGNRGMRTNSYGAMVSRRYGDRIIFAAVFRPGDEVLRGDGFFYAAYGCGASQFCKEHNTAHRLHTAKHGELERLTVMLEGSSKKFFKPPISTLGLEIATRCSFSSCIAATTVAMGKASALVTVENKPWDNWPAACIIKEAGGIVTDWQGNPFDPANCGNMVAAANPEDHAIIIEVLNHRGQ